jgi:hypothetical protein
MANPSADATVTLPVGATDTVVTLTGTQTLTNKTLTTPTIASFANAGHNHQDAAGGGTLAAYLAVAGGTMTGQLVLDNLGIEGEESDTNPTCSSGNYNIFVDASESKWKKCTDGVASDLDTTGGTTPVVFDATPEMAIPLAAAGSVYVTPNGRVNAAETDCRVRLPNGTYDNLEVLASSAQTASDLTVEVSEGVCTSAITYGGTLRATVSATANTVTTDTGALTVATGDCVCIKVTSAAGMLNPGYLSIAFQKTA